MHCQWFTISSCITWRYSAVTALKVCFHRKFSYCVYIYIYIYIYTCRCAWCQTCLKCIMTSNTFACFEQVPIRFEFELLQREIYFSVMKSVGYFLSLAAWIGICFMDRSRTVYKMCPLMLYRRNKVIQLGLTQGWINESILQKVCGL